MRMYRTSHSSIARYICRTQAHARFDALGERWFLFTASGAMPRPGEATTISPGQSSGAKAEERHPGYMIPVYHVRPVRTATYSFLLCSCPYMALNRWLYIRNPGCCPGLSVVGLSARQACCRSNACSLCMSQLFPKARRKFCRPLLRFSFFHRLLVAASA